MWSKSIQALLAFALALEALADSAQAATAYVAIDLIPSGFKSSYAFDTSGAQQVGGGAGTTTGNNYHALVWSGTAQSCVDLNPSGFSESGASGIGGTQQVGYGYGAATAGNWHALLWNGTAQSFVDLNPSGVTTTYACGTSGTQQVGYGGGTVTTSYCHALLWSGTAQSCVDLNPSGFATSQAYDISGIQQVGEGYAPDSPNGHALLWSGTAQSGVDLHPSEFTGSRSNGTNGTQQVGQGYGTTTGNNYHALVWSGTAQSCVDLQQFLPSGFNSSYARSIDSQGNIVGYALDASGNQHAILWAPVPEPSTFILLGMGAFGLLAFAWRRRRTICLTSLIIVVVAASAGSVKADVFNMPSGQTSLEMVTVGDPGNASDVIRSGFGGDVAYGKVDYSYSIGKYEVTAGQYAEFLNTVARTSDPYGLYNSNMATNPYGSPITYDSITHTYSATFPNRPVNWVSWGDAARFCNWLQTGTTENGAYTLNGRTDVDGLRRMPRNPGATYVIPTDDEWYKAAFYDPNKGTSGGYWLYPTKNNTTPKFEAPPGGLNSANYYQIVGHTTDAGAYTGSKSAYGTFDQGGNLWEWNEQIFYDTWRGARGGSFNDGYNLGAASESPYLPNDEYGIIGFRIASVPEPGSFALLLTATVGVSLFWWRRR